jgi:peroxiredoxin Q/BCP
MPRRLTPVPDRALLSGRYSPCMTISVSFDLVNQDEQPVSDRDFKGQKYVMFFYPRAMTPGCTTESCDFRDSYSEFSEAGYAIVGVSPDQPSANKKFKEKENLNFDLLSDVDHTLAGALGAWGEKKNYGKVFQGLIRSTFVVDEQGAVVKAYRNVRATGHVERVKADLLG